MEAPALRELEKTHPGIGQKVETALILLLQATKDTPYGASVALEAAHAAFESAVRQVAESIVQG